MDSPEIILNLVYGTKTMTEKRIKKFSRLFGEIIYIQNGKIKTKICEKISKAFGRIESFLDLKSIEIYHLLCIFCVDYNLVEVK